MNRVFTKTEIALKSFKSGLNCAQSVLTAYADELNLNKSQALELSSGFGGGMGRLQETCGAVTGAFMIIGIVNSRSYKEEERSEQTPADIQNYTHQFENIHGSISCGELLNCDLKTTEGQDNFKENKLGSIVCEKCISSSISILESVIKKSSS